MDVVPLQGAIIHCLCAMVGGGHFFSTLITTKIGFCYLGSMPVSFSIYFFVSCSEWAFGRLRH